MLSMTAFGRGEATNGDTTVVVEIRTLNHRFRDINLRVPKEYNALEPRITAIIRDAVGRGRVDCTVRRIAREGIVSVLPDLNLADAYFRALQEIARHLQQPATAITLDTLIAQPGVLAVTERDLDVTHEWDLLEPALIGAIDHLQEMRAMEGRALEQDAQRLIADFVHLRAEMQERQATIHVRLRRRMEERLSHLLADRIDPARLAQEAAILADKADISEELTRLGSHIDQFQDLFEVKQLAGRKMEFLLQEMSREVNTLGSKGVGQDASHIVVELKTILEKLREQSANIE